eukprot:CAMPEP_0201477036 /NCGR_PEP_ID=MMETSP0151_2-20130828/2154_1 /ASSEMBLY_ACC=CAM_ASM_000257 /TAXON_ID=200890 /ORGANISM="Paramoeba atlantica, Strain 621/1 / CCAP 1560/9" /LENGTH=1073 /DNA_ID=CAMNT_0047857639 /DNA_START=162 /DNA_END=3383 /DNA_ORIENTATION=-
MSDSPKVESSESNQKKDAPKPSAAKAEKIAAAKARKAKIKEEQEQKKAALAKSDKQIRLRQQFVNTTKPGEKKDLSGPMPDSYDPAQVEAAWYEWWEAQKLFEANENEKEKYKEKFIMVIPPPNVTGTLHLGHALTNAVEDTICRYHRMKGKQVLWVPGCDHAGIATQAVVEKQLARQGITRQDLGRDKFLEKVWEWKEDKGSRIYTQLQRLGSSLDWRRAAFTLDEPRKKSVLEAFVRMHDDGLIYREKRLVNWCCTLKTAIADIEVDHIELKGKTKRKVPGYPGNGFDFGIIEEFGYDVVDKEGNPILDEEGKPEVMIIATTRLETMLGDTAVAVHPEDKRYTKWHDKYAWHPYRKEAIPIILDAELVDMEFGTGCVKLTPAHDPRDYECGLKHGLRFLNVLTDDGLIDEIGGELFSGMKRYDARIKIRKDLQAKERHYSIKNNPMQLAICSRSGDIIEPLLKAQWWMNCESMAKKAVEAVENKDLEIIPPRFEATWFYWMRDIKPWCLSRQLWWGHRIPAWLVYKKGENRPRGNDDSDWMVGRSIEEVRQKAAEKFGCNADDLEYEQDEDVLDTWFSSGLFPFSVFGWPEQTADLERFYPIDLMETGHDILFFWAARMIMMGIHLTGQLPFKKIFLHAMVRDAHGRKMSKSLGNVVDPIDAIEGILLDQLHEKLRAGNLDPKEEKTAIEGQKRDFPKGIPECGTDALRLALCSNTGHGTSVNLNINQIVADRNFCNKMWNVVKLSMKFFPENFQPPPSNFSLPQAHRKEDAWILSRLNQAIIKANKGFVDFELGKATGGIKDFVLKELCDVYLEALKPLMYNKVEEDQQALQKELQTSALATLYICLDNMFRLLHPFMPFVTEELWQRLPKRNKGGEEEGEEEAFSIMISPYPSEEKNWENGEVEKEMEVVGEIVRTARKIRGEYGLTKQKPQGWLRTGHEQTSNFLKTYEHTLSLSQLDGKIEILGEGQIPEGDSNVTSIVLGTPVELIVNMKGMIDFEREMKALEKKIATVGKQILGLEKKRNNPNYLQKVPENVREEDAQKLEGAKEEKAKAIVALEKIRQMAEQSK